MFSCCVQSVSTQNHCFPHAFNSFLRNTHVFRAFPIGFLRNILVFLTFSICSYTNKPMFSFVFIILISIEDIYNTTGFTYQHATWVSFIACISLILYPYFKSKELYMYVNNAIIMTIMIFIIMSTIVYLKPEFFEKTFSTAIVGLLVALIAVIIVELTMLFLGNYDYKTYRMISYFVILLFSLFVSYDTTQMFTYARNCINSPNYPKASISFFLDLINLFVRLVGVARK